MPGRWQIQVVLALIQQSPSTMRTLCMRCGAYTMSERAACKRATRTLVDQGIVEKRALGVYALVVDVAALLRQQRRRHTRDTRAQECACLA